MKQTLLFSIVAFCSFFAHAQIAYNAPGVFVCDGSPANVHSQTDFVLGNQSQTQFAVTYHATPADAYAGMNAIPGTLAFSGSNIIMVYARVSDTVTGNFAVSSFKVVWYLPAYNYQFTDMYVCGQLELPYTEIGAFYTEPDGQGFQYAPGSTIYFWEYSGMLYWYAGNEECSVQSDPFYVLIDSQPMLANNYVTACAGSETFDLTQLNPGTDISFYTSEQEAWNMVNPIADPSAYQGTDGQSIWAHIQGFVCSDVQQFSLYFTACTPNSIYGRVRASQSGTGCNVADPGLPGCQVSRTFGAQTSHSYTNADGDYMFTNVPVGTNVIAPTPSQPFITVLNPVSANVDSVENSQLQADFCVKQDPYNDVRAILSPLGNFRPNITTQLLLQVANLGNTPASGSVALAYDASKTSYASASIVPATNELGSLTFHYTLQPHYAQNIYISFFTPTTTVLGDALSFNATTTLAGDQNLGNNDAGLNEIVVNSYDPNDIAVAEGAFISLAQAAGYLHYIVRFQNTGTAEAFDVRIENPLNDSLDASTFRPIAASHTYFAERTGSDVTFHFPNIDLPAEQVNEPESHGFVIYEIKPIAGIEAGAIIENQAFIYFDTNPAIDTNVITTSIQQLSNPENENGRFVIYPNPSGGNFTVRSVDEGQLSVEIFDARGTKVLSRQLLPTENEAVVDAGGLSSGLYLVKISSARGSSLKKLVIQ